MEESWVIKKYCAACGKRATLDDEEDTTRYMRRGNYCQDCDWKAGGDARRKIHSTGKNYLDLNSLFLEFASRRD